MFLLNVFHFVYHTRLLTLFYIGFNSLVFFQILQLHFLTLCWNLTVYGSAFFTGYVQIRVGSFIYGFGMLRFILEVARRFFTPYNLIAPSPLRELCAPFHCILAEKSIIDGHR